MKNFGLILGLALLVTLSSCGDDNTYTDGTYKAESKIFSHGWKEFMEVTITGDEITAVNFDAVNADGNLKSELTEYPMPDPPGLPSSWYPQLEAQYMAFDLENDDISSIDGISGATHTSDHSKEFFELILDAAMEGDMDVQLPLVYVDGDYKAEANGYSHGWKEFMEVSIAEDAVTAVNFDAINAGDTLKSELTEYPMPDPPGLPSGWYPLLEAQYMELDIVYSDTSAIDGITGATHTSDHSKEFFDLILDAAKEGDTEVQHPPIEE